MGLVKITFDGSSVSAKQDADINYHLSGMTKEGVIKGLGDNLSVSASNNYITFKSGYVQIYGRRIYVENNTQMYVSLDSTKQGYIAIQVNTSNNTVSLVKLEGTSLPSLTKSDLSKSGGIYQMAIAKYSKTPTSLTLDSSFNPEYIESPLEIADKSYRDAIKYINSNHFFYMHDARGYSQTTFYLTDEQFANINKTLFVVNIYGKTVAVPGWGASGVSSIQVSYPSGSNQHTLIVDVSDSKKALIFTCNTNADLIRYIFAYR